MLALAVSNETLIGVALVLIIVLVLFKIFGRL